MPADCEFEIREAVHCGVLAVGRCDHCQRAFCQSHGRNDKCLPHAEAAASQRWWDRIRNIERSDSPNVDLERRVSAKMVSLVNAKGDSAVPTIGWARAGLGLGPQKPWIFQGDTYHHTPLPALELAADSLAWCAIKELFLIEYFFLLDTSYNDALWASTYQSAMQKEFSDFGLRKYRFGTWIPRGVRSFWDDWSSDGEDWQGFTRALGSRRPSAQLSNAFARYWAEVEKVSNLTASLRRAEHADLVRYIQGGWDVEPEAWSLREGVLLEAVTWQRLAKALLDAGVPFGTGLTEETRGWLGRRLVSYEGWTVETRRHDSTYTTADVPVRILRRSGEIMTQKGGWLSPPATDMSQQETPDLETARHVIQLNQARAQS